MIINISELEKLRKARRLAKAKDSKFVFFQGTPMMMKFADFVIRYSNKKLNHHREFTITEYEKP